MWFYFVLSLCLLNLSLTEQVRGRGATVNLNDVFSSWPSYHHAAKTLQKRQAEVSPIKPGQIDTTPLHVDNQSEAKSLKVDGKGNLEQVSEGDVEFKSVPDLTAKQTIQLPDATQIKTTMSPKNESSSASGNTTENASNTVSNSTISSTPPKTVDSTAPKAVDSTAPKAVDSTAPKAPYPADLSNPGVMKRGLIVFGAFALMAVVYFIFYRRTSKSNESNNAHGTNDTNQFRYGVLQSDDRRDNLELSRIPLTMESDEDEDEDLEIFDLEQKKKSLSYVNLQTNDEYIVHEPTESERDRGNLLLDIEDATSDQLINWSNNANKSIL